MKITDRQLFNLPVVTESGQSIGKVVGFESDTEHHLILNYSVSASPLVTRLLGVRDKTLRIARSQVISIDQDRMVVKDAAVTEGVVVTGPLTAQVHTPPAPVTPTLFKQ